MYLNTTKRGFTLIELLVVVAIIGILSSIVLASLDTARSNARDTQRIADLKQLNLALTLYRNANGEWPCLDLPSEDRLIDDQTHCLADELVPDHIGSIPTDPLYGNDGETQWGNDYQYYASSVYDSFYLRTRFEGQPLRRNASYPNPPICQDTAEYPQCSWYGQECVYVTGSCDDYWIHISQ